MLGNDRHFTQRGQGTAIGVSNETVASANAGSRAQRSSPGISATMTMALKMTADRPPA
jgi:hypothetical protein